MQKVLAFCAVLCYTTSMKGIEQTITLPSLETAQAEFYRLLNMVGYMEDRQGFAPAELMRQCDLAEDVYRSCLMRDTGSSDF